jgi:hypothetical protein
MRTLGFRAWRAAWPLCALLLTGCATAHVYAVPRATPDVACLTPMPEQDLLIGVALSGGGAAPPSSGPRG